jgi:Flp pilus assembly protein TadG
MTRFWKTSERGAILIHVTVAMLGLLAFSALVIDYGIFWTARRQAQNSADAGALAGAMGLAFDDPKDFTDTGPAKLAARAAATANFVFGAAPDVNITTDVTFPACPDDGSNVCVKVDVYRTTARGNALPTFFARLVGITSQDMRATATAKVLTGNATECMRPFGIMDKWDEYDVATGGTEYEYNSDLIDPDWNHLTSTYDNYDSKGEDYTNKDLYVAHTTCPPDDPTSCVVGTGFRLFDDKNNPIDYGREIQIKTGAQDQTSAGWFMPLRLNDDDSGANDFCANIKGCSGVTNMIGQTVQTETGNMVGPTEQCLWTDKDSLYNQDKNAKWYDDKGGIWSPEYPALNSSPRIVPLPVISPETFFSTNPNGMSPVTISNIFGFFIEGTIDKDGNKIYGPGTGGQQLTFGRILTIPGEYAGGNVVDPSASFIKQIVLIR